MNPDYHDGEDCVHICGRCGADAMRHPVQSEIEDEDYGVRVFTNPCEDYSPALCRDCRDKEAGNDN